MRESLIINDYYISYHLSAVFFPSSFVVLLIFTFRTGLKGRLFLYRAPLLIHIALVIGGLFFLSPPSLRLSAEGGEDNGQ